MYEPRHIGDNYDATKALDVAEIAKLIRKDIKREFPAIKASVTTSRFSGGCAIDIRVKAAPFGLLNPARVLAEGSEHMDMPRYTPEASALLGRLREILQSYNKSSTDSSIDYFNERFYGDASVDWEIERDERKAILAGQVAA